MDKKYDKEVAWDILTTFAAIKSDNMYISIRELNNAVSNLLGEVVETYEPNHFEQFKNIARVPAIFTTDYLGFKMNFELDIEYDDLHMETDSGENALEIVGVYLTNARVEHGELEGNWNA